jgi:hypothetical protein
MQRSITDLDDEVEFSLGKNGDFEAIHSRSKAIRLSLCHTPSCYGYLLDSIFSFIPFVSGYDRDTIGVRFFCEHAISYHTVVVHVTIDNKVHSHEMYQILIYFLYIEPANFMPIIDLDFTH